MFGTIRRMPILNNNKNPNNYHLFTRIGWFNFSKGAGGLLIGRAVYDFYEWGVMNTQLVFCLYQTCAITCAQDVSSLRTVRDDDVTIYNMSKMSNISTVLFINVSIFLNVPIWCSWMPRGGGHHGCHCNNILNLLNYSIVVIWFIYYIYIHVKFRKVFG